ncbi:hypothetical protein ACO2Q3_13890 [Caulobacter sp. KR2-114]|uniref:hypothetical protein n=1 Tax=Caulobacter sp. KR2-114 TaxID=3400912 RepID=UPI003C007773
MTSEMTSAFAALVGATIGGTTSFASSWMTQWIQLKDKNLEAERGRREVLFAEFIDEASRLYGDALSHEKDEVGDLVRLYAIVARIRLVASAPVLAAAEATMDRIIATYLAPNRSLHELRDLAAEGQMNFLHDFGQACRLELVAFGHRHAAIGG